MQSFVASEPRLLSQMNERMVIRVLQEKGPSSRVELARYAGVTAPTVSKAVSTLLSNGLLEEYAVVDYSRGRPAKKLRLAEETVRVIGLVIDYPFCRLTCSGLGGKFSFEDQIKFKLAKTYDQLLSDITERIMDLNIGKDVLTLGMGICHPGLFDYREERSILSPNVPITNNQCIGKDLSKRLGFKCVVLQESAALCLAERHYGLARTIDNFCMLDASTGIGLGVLAGGRLLKGSNGLAGELGHLPVDPEGEVCGCGRKGCLETIASDRALSRLVSLRIGYDLDIEQIIELVKSNELTVGEELVRVIKKLAFALVTTINLFNPERLFIHSRMFDLDDSIFEELLKTTESMAVAPSFQMCQIERARGSKSEGAIAAIIESLTDSLISEPNSHVLNVL